MGCDNEDDTKIGMQRIVPHIFGSHENCKDADWCSYHQILEKFMKIFSIGIDNILFSVLSYFSKK